MRYPDTNKPMNEPNNTPMNKKAYIRFLHALPNDPPVNVDIYINKTLVVKNLKFEDFTEYLPARPGTYTIQIYPTGNHVEQLLSTHITLENKKAYTACVIGTINNIGIEIFTDFEGIPDKEKAYMRFVNLSPDAEAVDIYVDSKPVVYDLQFEEVTDYLTLDPGKHTLQVYISADNRRVVSHPNMVLKAGNYYTSYIVGLANGRPYIEILIPLDGISYLKF